MTTPEERSIKGLFLTVLVLVLASMLLFFEVINVQQQHTIDRQNDQIHHMQQNEPRGYYEIH